MGHMLAILFEDDPETDASSVCDIIRVEGVDPNARRRLRRAIINKHGLISRYGYSRVTYETWWPTGRIGVQDVTRRFLVKPTTGGRNPRPARPRDAFPLLAKPGSEA